MEEQGFTGEEVGLFEKLQLNSSCTITSFISSLVVLS